MPKVSRILEVYKAGELTVVGFGSESVLDRINVTQCRDEISKLIKKHHCKVFAIDLTNVKLLPSGMIGLLASLHKQLGVDVHIYNPCRDIRDVLEIMKLDRILHIHDLEL